MTKEEIDLIPFLTDLVREREQAIIDAGLSLDLRGKRGRIVEADPRQLAKAVGHLLDNAIAATPDGGRILIELPRPEADDAWTTSIVISDNGPGMSANALSRALDGLSSSEDGTIEKRVGLGIPLARQLVEAHGGTLEIISEEGAGTAAIIRLP
jgi:signal transduction histidine kinase